MDITDFIQVNFCSDWQYAAITHGTFIQILHELRNQHSLESAKCCCIIRKTDVEYSWYFTDIPEIQ